MVKIIPQKKVKFKVGFCQYDAQLLRRVFTTHFLFNMYNNNYYYWSILFQTSIQIHQEGNGYKNAFYC